MIADLFSSPVPKFQQFLNFSDLPGSSAPLLINQIATQLDHLVLVITQDNQQTQMIQDALRFFNPQIKLLHFPDWETLPYDLLSPHADLISQRLTALTQLPNLRSGVLCVPITTLMQRLAPKNFVATHSLILYRGQIISLDQLRAYIQSNGYLCASTVVEHGQFAIRGSILDLFPMGSDGAYRIDWQDDCIDSIRSFDPETQRSIERLEKIQVLPAKEFPITPESLQTFRQRWRAQFSGDPTDCPIYTELSLNHLPAGIEYYLPLFFQETHSLLDYIPNQTLVVSLDHGEIHAEQFWQQVNTHYQQRRHDRTHPILPPDQLYDVPKSVFDRIETFTRIFINRLPIDYDFNLKSLPDLRLKTLHHPLDELIHFLDEIQPRRVLFCVESLSRQTDLLNLLKDLNQSIVPCSDWQDFLTKSYGWYCCIAPLHEGFYCSDASFALITESQLLGTPVVTSRRYQRHKQLDPDFLIRNLSQLKIGDLVVHRDHGVGRYLGLQTLEDQTTEFLILAYAQQTKLYVPITSIELISRYHGVADDVELQSLGSNQWKKTQRKVAEQIKDVAAHLLDLYAHRAAHQGFSFPFPEKEYALFIRGFPFSETPDQIATIGAVISDMTHEKVMDRIICGDVGFGKTEIALRAAFIAAHAGKQVAILVPTTLLAEQHERTFRDRFAHWPIEIDLLSRFRSIKQQKNILQRLEAGTLDIIIGTHKLLDKKIKFHDLGLLIVDEEHRFGVQQKERLNALRTQIDLLTLTATPIPRTLNMALMGLRELSLITTPPQRRLAIKTFVAEYDPGLIRDAILRELLRGGQVFFLHNKVQTIEKIAQELQALVPQARIQRAHGQLPARQLEQIMHDFYHQKFNVLVCTTIIETGIDIPTTNTIIIQRADQFGLAQLHQLRGRVGRSHHQAYAYLLIPPRQTLAEDAIKRLDTIVHSGDLGFGFSLATHDLEIRGAGELLGEHQSGNIGAIGFNLYQELLGKTVAALKSGQAIDLEKAWSCERVEIDLQIPVLLPDYYVDDVATRLMFYKRLASANSFEQLRQLQIELIDRFGLLPEAAKNLFEQKTFALRAQQLGIKKIEVYAQGGKLEFLQQTRVAPERILALIQDDPQRYRLLNSNTFAFSVEQANAQKRLSNLSELLDRLAQ